MKVLLLQDVPNVGRKYEIKKVADGFGLNMLLPKGLARTATASTIAEYEERKRKHEEEVKKREEALASKVGELSEAKVTIRKKANEQGHLFASVHASDVADAVKKELDLDIDAGHIKLEHALDEVGEHEVEMELAGNIVTLTVEIEGEKK